LDNADNPHIGTSLALDHISAHFKDGVIEHPEVL